MSQPITITIEHYWDGYRAFVESGRQQIDGMEVRGQPNVADALRMIGEKIDQAPGGHVGEQIKDASGSACENGMARDGHCMKVDCPIHRKPA